MTTYFYSSLIVTVFATNLAIQVVSMTSVHGNITSSPAFSPQQASPSPFQQPFRDQNQITRDVHGDLFTMRGEECDPIIDHCGRRGRFAASVQNPIQCQCQCAPSYPIFREDVSECVKEINDCSLVKFVSAYVTEKVPVIALPTNGELLYPGAHVSMTDSVNLDMDFDPKNDNSLANCQVMANEVLTPHGWQSIQEEDKVFDISVQSSFGSSNRTYLRFIGRNEMRPSLENKLILIQLVCSVKEEGVQFELTPCAAVRIAWVPAIPDVGIPKFGMPRENPTLLSEESSMVENTIKSSAGSKILSQSSQNYLIIGLSLGILGCMYVMALMIYLRTKTVHERKRTVVINSSSLHSPNGNASSSSSDTVTTGINNPGDLSDSPSNSADSPTGVQLKHYRGHQDGKHFKKYDKKISSKDCHRKSSIILAPSQLANSSTLNHPLAKSLDQLDQIGSRTPDLKRNSTETAPRLGQHRLAKIETSIEITPEMLDPDYSPASALEFIRRIRDIITSARGRIKNFRFRPTLIAIPEDDYFYHDLQITPNPGVKPGSKEPTPLSSLSSLTDSGNQVPPPPPPKIGLLRSRDHFSLSTPFSDRRRTAYFGFYPHSSERFTLPDDDKLFNDDLWCEYTGNETSAASFPHPFEPHQRRREEGRKEGRDGDVCGERRRDTSSKALHPIQESSAPIEEMRHLFKSSRITSENSNGSVWIGIPEEDEEKSEREKLGRDTQKELLDTLDEFVARNESSVDDCDGNDAVNLTAINAVTFAPSSSTETTSHKDIAGHKDHSSETSCGREEAKMLGEESIYGDLRDKNSGDRYKDGNLVKKQDSISITNACEEQVKITAAEHIYSESDDIYGTSSELYSTRSSSGLKSLEPTAIDTHRAITHKTKDIFKSIGKKSKGKEPTSDGNWSLQTSRPNSRASMPPVSPVSKPLTLEEVMARKLEECQKRMKEEKTRDQKWTDAVTADASINSGTIGRYAKKKVPSQSSRKRYQSGKKGPNNQSDGEDGATSDTGTTTTSVSGLSDICSVSSCEISTTSSYLINESSYDTQSVTSTFSTGSVPGHSTGYSSDHSNGHSTKQLNEKMKEKRLHESLVDSEDEGTKTIKNEDVSDRIAPNDPIDVCLQQLASASVDDQEPFFAKFTRSTKGMETLEKIKNSSWRHFCNQDSRGEKSKKEQENLIPSESKVPTGQYANRQRKWADEDDYEKTGISRDESDQNTWQSGSRRDALYSSGDELESVAASSIAFNSTHCRPSEDDEDSDDTLTEGNGNKYETLQSRKKERKTIREDTYENIDDDDNSTIHEADVCEDETMETMSRKFISCRNFIENKMFSGNGSNNYEQDQIQSTFVTKIPV